MRRWLREPLLLFISAGLVLFALYDWLAVEAPLDEPQMIRVDRNSLLQFVQDRSKNFDRTAALKRLDGLSEQALQDVVQDFVREEALYRTALRYGLDADDYVIKRRLVQKMDYVAEGLAQAGTPAAEAELRSYYDSHHSRYREPSTVTFTHVFLRNADAAQAAALLQRLNNTTAEFTDAPRFGDRFPYHQNYVERPYEEVQNHFGEDMAARLFALTPAPRVWQGVFNSDHGRHLVLLTRSTPARQLDFEEARAQVSRDYNAEMSYLLQQRFVQSIVESFEVELADDLQRG